MYRSILADKAAESAKNVQDTARTVVVHERITITRDERSNEWVVELGLGLDSLEVIQVLNQVQHQAIEMMQEQIMSAALPSSPVSDNIDPSLRDTVRF